MKNIYLGPFINRFAIEYRPSYLKRGLWFFSILFCFTFILPALVHADITSNLQGFWNFNDGSGTIAADCSPQIIAGSSITAGNANCTGSNTGTLVNSPVWTTTNCVSTNSDCLEFNGTSQYVSVNDAASLDFGTGDFSITLWVKLNSTSSMRMVNKWTGTTGFIFDVNSTTGGANAPGNLRFRMEDGSNSTDDNVSAEMPTGSWEFVAVTVHRNSSTGVVFYLNGSPVGAGQSSSLTTGSITNSNPLGIGTIVNDLGSYFNGYIDDVRVYNRSLSSNDIIQLYGKTLITLATNQTFYVTAPANVQLTAVASPAAGVTVTNVEFYSNVIGSNTNVDLGGSNNVSSSTSFGTCQVGTNANTYTLTCNNVPNGGYTLTAVVSDNTYPPNTSTPISMTILGKPNTDGTPGDITSGLVAWWQFDEGQGFEAQDSSGNGYNIWLDSPMWLSPGVIGSAININGNPNVTTPTSVDLSMTHQATVSFWGASGAGIALGSWGNANAFAFYANGGTSVACQSPANPKGNSNGYYFSVKAAETSVYCWPFPNLDTWHHYVAIFDNTSISLLYIDGVLQTPVSSVQNGQGTGNFTKRPFNLNGGQIDDVRVYDRALSSTEVQQLYNLGTNANPSDSNAPTVSLTAPASGATIYGSGVTVSATALSNSGMAGVQFKVDGSNVGAEVTTSPYSLTLDSTQFVNGNHIITAEAHDSNGNVSSARISVVVSNTPPPLPLPTTETYTTFLGQLSVNWSNIENITQAFGAKGDAERLTANTTANINTITIDADHALSSVDVGKVVEIFQAGANTSGNNYQDLVTTISSVTGPQTAVLAMAPGRTVNAARTIIGTNNATAFQNAVNSSEIPVQFNTTAGNATVTVTGHTLGSQDVGLTVNLPNAVPLTYTSGLNNFTSTVASYTTQVITGDSFYTLTLNSPYYNAAPGSLSGYFGSNPNAYNFWVTQIVSNQWSSTVTIYPVGFSMSQVSGLSMTIKNIQPNFTNLTSTISSVNTANNTAVLAVAPNITTNGLSGTMDTDSGIVLYVPNGQYLIVPPALLSSFSLSNAYSVDFGFTISTAGIRFQGQDVNHTILLGNGAWQLDSSGQYVERGNMFDVTNPSSGPVTSNLPLEFYNLTFDGGVSQGKRYTSGQYWPANPVAGDGWDVTHDLFLDSGSAREQIYKSFINCIITHWRGEMMKDTGGSGYGYSNYTDPTKEEINDIENTSFIDGDASALNIFFTHTYNNLYVDNVAMAEEFWEGYAYGESVFENSTIINTGIYNSQGTSNGGITVDGAESKDENTSYRIENNTFDGDFYGVYITPGAHLTIRGNRFIGGVGGIEADDAGYEGGDYEHDFLIEQNYFKSISAPVGLYGTYQGLHTGITVRHNMVQDPWGGASMGGSYTMSYDIFSNNFNYGPGFSSNQAVAQPYQPEIINDDGSSDYSFTLHTGLGSGGPATISFASGGTWQGINWTGSVPWALDDTTPATMPTYGPNTVADPAAVPTVFPANPALPQSGALSSTDAPAHSFMIIYNTGGSQATLYLSKSAYLAASTAPGITCASTTAMPCTYIPNGQEILVTWSGTQWNLTAGPETPPTVVLSSPSNNAVYTEPANISLGANTTVASGDSVAKVEYFVNTYLVNSSPTLGYSSFVDSNGDTINNVTPGTYLIYAKVTDSKGIVAYSSPITITVNTPPPVSYVLTVSATGNGEVFGPNSIECGVNSNPVCSASFNAGAQVTLTATPGSGSVFTGWSGACSGTGSCILTMSAAENVTANFASSTINGVCGAASQTYLYNVTSFGNNALCKAGNPNPATVAFPVPGGLVNWTCVGLNNGFNSTCKAKRNPRAIVKLL